jgi:hypothetical protein
LTTAENPGLVGGIKMPIINKIKERFFGEIMEGFKQVDIDDMKVGDLSITAISAEVVNDNHNNVQLSFQEDKNGLAVSVDNTYVNVHVHWRYKKSILKFSGTGDVKGPISNVRMILGFDTQEKDGFLVPKMSITDFNISLEKKQWHFHFNCKGCIAKINDLILNAFKGPLVDKIKSEARKVVNNKVADIVNKQILERYPLSVPLTNEISISTATTGPVSVRSDFVSVPVDSTIYLTEEGYNRPFEAPEAPKENPDNPGEIILVATKYVFQTLERTINKVPMSFETRVLGLAVRIDIDGSRVPLEIDTRNNELHVLGGAVITIPFLRTSIEIGASSDIDLFFKPGDSENMIFVEPDLDRASMKLTTFSITMFGFRLEFGFLLNFINALVAPLINMFMLNRIAIPKLEQLPLTATAAIVDFQETYTEAGIAFNFGADQ